LLKGGEDRASLDGPCFIDTVSDEAIKRFAHRAHRADLAFELLFLLDRALADVAATGGIATTQDEELAYLCEREAALLGVSDEAHAPGGVLVVKPVPGEVYNISNNSIINATSLGTIGSEWQVLGFGNFSSRGESDMLLRNSNTGALELYDINNNQITGARAPSGNAAAAPPSSVMKSRRLLIRSPHRRGRAASAARQGRGHLPS
jgi:hypothetical protein